MFISIYSDYLKPFIFQTKELVDMAEFEEIFESFKCMICYQEYQQSIYPIIICSNHHFVCNMCYPQIQTFHQVKYPSFYYDVQKKIKCPFCKQIELRSRSIEFKKFFEIRDAAAKIKKREKQANALIAKLTQKVKQMSEQLVTLQVQLMYTEGLLETKDQERKYQNSTSGNSQLFASSQAKPKKNAFDQKIQRELINFKNENKRLEQINSNLRKDLNFSDNFIMKMASRLLKLQKSQLKMNKWKYNQVDFVQIEKLVRDFQQFFHKYQRKKSFFQQESTCQNMFEQSTLRKTRLIELPHVESDYFKDIYKSKTCQDKQQIIKIQPKKNLSHFSEGLNPRKTLCNTNQAVDTNIYFMNKEKKLKRCRTKRNVDQTQTNLASTRKKKAKID